MSAEVETLPGQIPGGEKLKEIGSAIARVLVPVLLALVIGGIILLILGKDPLAYYGYVARRGLLTWGGLQETFTRMAPLLLIGEGTSEIQRMVIGKKLLQRHKI